MIRTKLTWNGDAADARARAGAVRGLKLGAEHLLSESRRLVPIEEGTLERSGVASVDEGELLAAVSYDGPYCVVQHERLDYRHDPGRSAKYLEIPAIQERDTIQALIAAEVRPALK